MSDVREKAQWLRAQREKCGWSTTEVARRVVQEAERLGFPITLTQQSVSGFENGNTKSVPAWISVAERIFAEPTSVSEATAGLSPHQQRFLELFEAADQERQMAALSSLNPRAGDQSDKLEQQRTIAQLDLVPIASIDMAYGMGGTFADGAINVEVMHFPRPWLEAMTTTPPALLTWARGRGNSMSPTIEDNDVILIDRSDRSVRDQDAIWAFTIGDIGMMKRLRIRGEKVTILSDNDRVPPDYAHPDEINIVGRVSHIVRRL
jgi:phage repressor protein C with HTH and peptisase S24 domain